jgi:hypothetical protein
LFNIGGIDEYIHTPFASIRRQSIEPVRKQDTDIVNTHPTSIGSRIGVVYVFKQKSIHMHCILNGFDYGPFSILKIESPSIENEEILFSPKKRQRTCLISDQSINEYSKFWAFVDVYGATKRVRMLQLYGRKSSLISAQIFLDIVSFDIASTLKSLCRSTILPNLHSSDQINDFSLCTRLKSYLKFHIN